jgi:hypothetical protein
VIKQVRFIHLHNKCQFDEGSMLNFDFEKSVWDWVGKCFLKMFVFFKYIKINFLLFLTLKPSKIY